VPLKPLYRYTLLLILLDILIISTGYFVVTIIKLNLIISNLTLLTLFFSIIAIVTLSVFFRGQTKDPESQTLHSLVAISLKFLLEIGLAIIWFIVAKKKGFQSVLIFFVLYLTLTLFSILVILKTLKNRSL
jgi:hypothetical protein